MDDHQSRSNRKSGQATLLPEPLMLFLVGAISLIVIWSDGNGGRLLWVLLVDLALAIRVFMTDDLDRRKWSALMAVPMVLWILAVPVHDTFFR